MKYLILKQNKAMPGTHNPKKATIPYEKNTKRTLQTDHRRTNTNT